MKVYIFISRFLNIKNLLKIKEKEMTSILEQKELRELYKERLKREKQQYIAEVTGINAGVLSKFKNGKFDLYPYLSEKLEAYLLGKP